MGARTYIIRNRVLDVLEAPPVFSALIAEVRTTAFRSDECQGRFALDGCSRVKVLSKGVRHDLKITHQRFDVGEDAVIHGLVDVSLANPSYIPMTDVGAIDVTTLELFHTVERAVDVELSQDVNGDVL